MTVSSGLVLGGARVLCLDDGGIRCLSSLVVLRRLMESVRVSLKLDVVPEPWQQFDLVCGSGFGGLVALMLGRLHMTINECENWFLTRYPLVFKTRQPWTTSRHAPTPDECSILLGSEFRQLLKSRGINDDTELDDGHPGETCKTFVLAMRTDNMRSPVRLRSYSCPKEAIVQNCTVFEAARATTALLGLLHPINIKMGDASVAHVSASLGCPNPTKEALDEVFSIWPQSDVSCIVSIGTGAMSRGYLARDMGRRSLVTIRKLFNNPQQPDSSSAISRTATECARTHQELIRNPQLLSLKYFRFNADTGSDTPEYHQGARVGSLVTKTDEYLQRHETIHALSFCALYILTVPRINVQAQAKASPNTTRTSCVEEGMTLPELGGNGNDLIQQRKYFRREKVVPTLEWTTKKLPNMVDGQVTEDPKTSDEHLRVPSTNTMFDANEIDTTSEQSNASKSVDKWFATLTERVHPVVDRRRKENDKRVKVAVLDTGVDASHPCFSEHQFGDINSHDWTNSEFGIDDRHGHGTHTAALTLKVAPNAELFIAKVFESQESDDMGANHVAEAIEHATKTWQVDIITMSFGFLKRNQRIRTAVSAAHAQGIIIFAAASNNGAIGGRKTSFPASITGQVIKISSTDGWGSKSRFNPTPSSNDDNFSTIGEAVESAWPRHLSSAAGEPKKRQSGTSVATPIAAGIAALVLEFASQRPTKKTISNSTSLWHYDGMRAILARMAQDSPCDGLQWIRPWEIFDDEKETDDIARDIRFELERSGF